MKEEKYSAKKFVLNKRTIAKLNENQMTVIKGGNAFFVQASDEQDPYTGPSICTSNRPQTSFGDGVTA